MTRHKAWGRLSSLPDSLERLSHSAEMWFVVGVTVALLVVTSIPYAYGYLSCPSDKWFSGVVYNMHDTGQYLSWMRDAGTSFLTDNKLTAERNARVFVNLHWWIPGRLARVFGLTFAQVYQVFRLVAVSLLTVITYACCAVLFSERCQRRFAFLLSTLTSGLGWVWVVLKYVTKGAAPFFPHDIYTTPGNSFWVMLASPHLTFAAALTLGVLLLALLSVWQRRFGYALAAAVLALFLGLGHIYDLVTVWAVLALFGLLLALRDGWSWRVFFSLALVVLVSVPAALYWGWVSSDAHPVWQQALAQYDNLGAFTPDPAHLVILLGGTFLLALMTFDGLVPLRGQTDGRLLLKGWFVIVPLLVYLPLHFQIMLLTGYSLPMAVLATVGLFDHVLPWLRERVSGSHPRRWLTGERLNRVVPALLLLAVSATNLYLLAWRVVDLHRHEYPFYLHSDEITAMRWLEEYTAPDEVVLSGFVVGHFIPGLTGDRAFLGNGVMTLDFNHKREMVKAFFDPETTDSERRALIREYGICYVFYGPAERALGRYDPGASSLFVEVFSSPRVRLYAVQE
jgi:hypothetical protein